MIENKPFYYYYDDYDGGYMIEHIDNKAIFHVDEEYEAKTIVLFLNKQEDIITDLQKTKPINKVSIIKIKQDLNDKLAFYKKFKSTSAMSEIKYNCFKELKERWFND